MASLESVNGKIRWAHRCIELIVAEIRGYPHDEVSKATLSEIEVNAGRGFSLGMEEGDVPPSVPYLVGDCLQNLRTSLDYLVWELVLSVGNIPNEKNQFPVCETSDGFKSQVKRHRLDGIPALALAEIESLQPYHCGQSGASNYLLILDKLCNINKHRRLILTTGTPVGIFAEALNERGSPKAAFIPAGDHATDIVLPALTAEEMRMEGISVHCVTFEESAVRGEQVNQVLGRIGLQIVSNVIPRFEKFFG